jgi:hypothetical protein
MARVGFDVATYGLKEYFTRQKAYRAESTDS